MKWIKQGLVFEPPGNLDWMATHAVLPFAERVQNYHRVYFSGRDEKGRSQIGCFEIDLANPQKVLRVSDSPMVGLGSLGSFDDSGVSNSWLVNCGGKKYLYYTGWNLGVTVPFYFYIGLAVSEDGGESFCKISEAPVMGRNKIDPYLTASPCILIEDGVWRMWYVSCIKWEMEDSRPRHYYHIKYAESKDGIKWERTGIVCIEFKSKDEYAISRPCVVKEDELYKMWYSYRGKSYRIGYAESRDGIQWERKDNEAGIDVSESGWDSEMICYPYVFRHKGEKYMLYNGNGYGQTGIGLAVLDQEK